MSASRACSTRSPGRKHLARVSNTPGRTQQINFFDLGSHLMLVDLPGHGYAKVSKSKVKGWTRLVDSYIRGRPNLRRILLLVDANVGTKDADETLMDLMDESGLSYQIVMTKADRLKPAALEQDARQAGRPGAQAPGLPPGDSGDQRGGRHRHCRIASGARRVCLTRRGLPRSGLSCRLISRRGIPMVSALFLEGLKPRCLRSTTPTPSTGCAPRGP